ncbi:hypothetical protein GCM10027295_10950 [Pseudaeromonas pectinilytica]
MALLIQPGSLVLTGQDAMKLTKKVGCQGKAQESPQDVGKDTSLEGDSTASTDNSLCQDG